MNSIRDSGLTFVPITFTTSGGMGESFQRQIWLAHWKRVEAEDAEMKMGTNRRIRLRLGSRKETYCLKWEV